MLKYFDLQRYIALHREQLQQAVNRVVDSGWYLLGNEVKAFEKATPNTSARRIVWPAEMDWTPFRSSSRPTLREVCYALETRY